MAVQATTTPTAFTLANRVVVAAATAALDDDNDTAQRLYELAARHFRAAGDEAEAVLAEVRAEDCAAELAASHVLPIAA
jgi:hypothetical protein